jgi:hypothetical protein
MNINNYATSGVDQDISTTSDVEFGSVNTNTISNSEDIGTDILMAIACVNNGFGQSRINLTSEDVYITGNLYAESDSYTKFRLSDLGVFSIAKPYPAGGDNPWSELFYIQPSDMSARIYTSLQVDSNLIVGADIVGSRSSFADITTNIECFNTLDGGTDTGTINLKSDSLNLLSEGNIDSVY